MIELCYFSLNQWEIKIHLLWGKCFNIPHWPRSHSTNERLQHIEELSKSKRRLLHCDPHLDQTKLNDLLPLTIDGVLVKGNNPLNLVWSKWGSQCQLLSWIWKALQCVAIYHRLSGFSANEEYWNISLKAYISLSLIGGEKSSIVPS